MEPGQPGQGRPRVKAADVHAARLAKLGKLSALSGAPINKEEECRLDAVLKVIEGLDRPETDKIPAGPLAAMRDGGHDSVVVMALDSSVHGPLRTGFGLLKSMFGDIYADATEKKQLPPSYQLLWDEIENPERGVFKARLKATHSGAGTHYVIEAYLPKGD